MSTWFFSIFKVINITSEAFYVTTCQFPKGKNNKDIINGDN
jgi:hypothetical protein